MEHNIIGLNQPPNSFGDTTAQIGDDKSLLQAEASSNWPLIWFVVLHVPLAVITRILPLLSAVHALSVFAIGWAADLFCPKDDHRPLWAAAYIVGAEVMWRRTGAADLLAWEFGKYAVIVILGIAVARRYRRQPLPALPLIYFACLLPALLFFVNEDFSIELALMRRRAVGNLVGPFSLALCAIYFSNLKLDRKALKRLAFIVIAPSIGMATLVAYNIITLGDALRFGRSSNQLVAGGGANQVSNSLALGGVFAWLLLSQPRMGKLERLVLFGILIGLTVAAFLTFSRGGVFTLGMVILCTLLFILKNAPDRKQLALMMILATVAATYLIWPWFIEYTSGFGAERFSSLDTSGRWELAQGEIQVWLENPIFGVGPGLAKEEVIDYLGFAFQAHVEYTRLLAEHGLYGLVALFILIIGAFKRYGQAKYWETRVWVIALMVYTFAYMAQAATRTVTPGFTYGLAWACLFAQSQVGHPSRRAQSHARPVHHA